MGRMSADPAGTRVLVVGDANPDLILQGDVMPRFGQAEQLLDQAALVIGGSAAITAHGFARLGRTVSLSAAIGDDVFGTQMSRDLVAAGVDIDPLVHRPDVPTGVTVVLSRSADRAILTLPGAIPTLTADEVRAAVSSLPDVRHVHVSSLFLVPELARDLPQLLAEIRASGITTSLDTNDDPAAEWQGLEALLPHLDVLLPNRREVVALARYDDPHQAAMRLAKQGPLVIVKDGPNGAFATTPSGESFDVAGETRTSLDTTGAGDSFNAAFLDAWLTGRPLASCVERAVLAGALAVTALGGTAGQPTSQDLINVGRTS
jgi:ribokinase